MMLKARWNTVIVLARGRGVEMMDAGAIVTEIEKDYVPPDSFPEDYDAEQKVAVYSRFGLGLMFRDALIRHW